MADWSYDDIQGLLAASRATSDAAEAHGTLAGALCAAPGGYRAEDWFGEILPEGSQPGSSAEATLRAIFTSTDEALHSRAMEFEMLLPDDDEPLDQRAAALGSWCQGFLYGLGSSHIRDVRELPGDAGEVVRDLIEITRVSVDVTDGLESNETAYAELVEFVRVGVQLVYENLAPLRAATPRPPDEVLH